MFEIADSLNENILEMIEARAYLTEMRDRGSELLRHLKRSSIGHTLMFQRRCMWTALTLSYARTWDTNTDTVRLHSPMNQVKQEAPLLPIGPVASDERKIREDARRRAIDTFEMQTDSKVHKLIMAARNEYYAHEMLAVQKRSLREKKGMLEDEATRQDLIDAVDISKACFKDAAFYLLSATYTYGQFEATVQEHANCYIIS